MSEAPRTEAVAKRIGSALASYAFRRSAGERGTLVDAGAEIDNALDECRQLERDLAAAKSDSERLDWLEKHDAETFSDGGFGDGESRWSCTWATGTNNDRRYTSTTGHDSIRDAIDAARTQPPFP